MKMKMNMLKLVLASAILLVMGTIVVSAAAPAEPAPVGFAPFQDHLTPPVDGGGGGGSTGRAWWTLDGSQFRVSSTHNGRQHRGRVTLGGNVIYSPWTNRNVQSNSQWVTRSGNAAIGTATLQTR